MKLSTIPDAIEALRNGKPVLVTDDEQRENEGDAVMAAEYASAEWLAWIIRHTSGYLTAPMTGEIADRLDLPLMVPQNQDPFRTQYTISVDAAEGVGTGISAADRARTLRVLADPNSKPESLIRPGHMIPLRAHPGGVRKRPGHTEATVELLQLAGLTPVGVIGEITLDNGEMAQLPQVLELGHRDGLPVVTIAQLIEYLEEHTAPVPGTAFAQNRVQFEVETNIPTDLGAFRFRGYRDLKTGAAHLAVISGELGENPIIRMHSECLTGEAFHSQKCECGPQLDAALATIREQGGAVIYLRGQEGRGIGLINKLKAYKLQEQGQDTLQANLSLNLPADAREYGAAVAILKDLGVTSVRLLTNNPDKESQLAEMGVTVSERLPLIVGLNETNKKYLEAKRDRMGHLLPEQI